MTSKKMKTAPRMLVMPELPPQPHWAAMPETDAIKEKGIFKKVLDTLREHLGVGKVTIQDDWTRVQVLKVGDEVTCRILRDRFKGASLLVDPGYVYRPTRRKKRTFSFPLDLDKVKGHIELMVKLAKQDKQHQREREAARKAAHRAQETAEKAFKKVTSSAPQGLIDAFDLEDYGTNFELKLSSLTLDDVSALVKLLTPWFEQRVKVRT